MATEYHKWLEEKGLTTEAVTRELASTGKVQKIKTFWLERNDGTRIAPKELVGRIVGESSYDLAPYPVVTWLQEHGFDVHRTSVSPSHKTLKFGISRAATR